jgi:hypothetical protein
MTVYKIQSNGPLSSNNNRETHTQRQQGYLICPLTKITGRTQAQKEEDDLISFLTKIKKTHKGTQTAWLSHNARNKSYGGYTDRWTDTKRYADRQ